MCRRTTSGSSVCRSRIGRRNRHLFFFFQAEDGIRDYKVTGVQTCALPISYWELTKPRIVLLLDFTAVMAFLVATSTINVVRLVAVIVGGTPASGGGGALNCYLDRDLDRTMGRTSRRPIPQGEVSPVHALVFGLALFGAGIVVSALLLPFLASLSILLGAAIYVLFYTKYLKPRTTLNIVL